jgi:nucleoside phosphorylase
MLAMCKVFRMSLDTSYGPFASAPVSHILTKDLSTRVILCAGEVEADLLHAFRNVKSRPVGVGQYRCYKFWKYPDFTLILSGIGTGSLEPLLWEIISPGVIKKIVLIGTAGAVTPRAPEIGASAFISEAWPCGTSLDAEVGMNPLRPHWNAVLNGVTCTLASTDYFYGYSDRILDGSFRACQGPFKERYKTIRDKADMIDMEVVGFYYFCPFFDKTGELEYIAIKGSSNALGKGEEMNQYAAAVMDDCGRRALEMLELARPAR